MQILVLICRILVGTLFIISGLIKANDPVGFSIKLTEYFTVFGTEWLIPLALPLSMFICIFEVVCGVTTITGTKAKATAWSLMGMIVFFTFLTFYSAYFNKVTDCGCFGDAIKLTPWQSFTKDILLLVFIFPIFIYRNKITSALPAKGDWILIGLATISTTWFTMHCYNHLPVKDFRPYAIGKDLNKQMEIPKGAPVDVYETILTYKNLKTGELKDFTQDAYMKARIWEDTLTWKWDTTVSKLVKEGYKTPIHDFAVRSLDGSTDITQDVLHNPNYVILLVAYDLGKTNTANMEKITALANGIMPKGVEFIGLTGGSYKAVEDFRHEHQCMFEFYNVDETQLKTMIRANPGIILLKNGVVVNMWHHNDTPTVEEFTETYLKK